MLGLLVLVVEPLLLLIGPLVLFVFVLVALLVLLSFSFLDVSPLVDLFLALPPPVSSLGRAVETQDHSEHSL